MKWRRISDGDVFINCHFLNPHATWGSSSRAPQLHNFGNVLVCWQVTGVLLWKCRQSFFFLFSFLQYFPSFVPLCYFVHDKLNDDYDSGMFINI